MELLEGETIVWRGKPSWRGNIGWYIVWIGLALVPAVLAGLVKASDREPWGGYWKWILVTVLLVLLVIAYDALRRHAMRYVVTDRRIQIRSGILARREQSTHLDRVQNLNTSQSLIERILRVGTVEFDTAGSEVQDAEFRFAGVADPHGIVRNLQPHIARFHAAGTSGPPRL